MKRVSSASPLTFIVLIASLLHAQTRPPEPTTQDQDIDVIRVSTRLVTVPVTVLDRHGRFVPDLTQEQFRIFEDGVEQDIAFFENADTPFVVALLLDVSDSTERQLKGIREAAKGFVEQLRPNDRVLICVFDANLSVLSTLTNDRAQLGAAIDRAKPGGGTALYDSLDLVAKKYLNPIRGRKAIVLFTDGVDTASARMDYLRSLHDAKELDALVYPIQYNTTGDQTGRTNSGMNQMGSVQVVTARGERLSVAYQRGTRYLNLLAEYSGGRFFFADTPKRLTTLFAQVAKELREQYSLGYYPKSQSTIEEQRAIKVRLSVPGVVVRTRRSYTYKPSPVK